MPIPATPRAATEIPITAPPWKAMDSALGIPPVIAPCVARTADRVEAFIPTKPASNEHVAPVKKARLV
ncbi:hypothetical protein ES703_64388 [subsurface metagenome]